jgi:hypothetical protein
MNDLWLVLGGVITLGTLGRAMAIRRHELSRMREMAARHRLRFSARDPIGLHNRYHNLELIRQGHGRHVCHVLHGRSVAGPVSFFAYNYDIGFGAAQSTRRWWFAVVETQQLHDHWLAVPKGSASWPSRVEMGGFALRCDHEATPGRLLDAGLERLLSESPEGSCWEVRGPWIAAACPCEAIGRTPDELITASVAVAQLLADAAPAGSLSELH